MQYNFFIAFLTLRRTCCCRNIEGTIMKMLFVLLLTLLSDSFGMFWLLTDFVNLLFQLKQNPCKGEEDVYYSYEFYSDEDEASMENSDEHGDEYSEEEPTDYEEMENYDDFDSGGSRKKKGFLDDFQASLGMSKGFRSSKNGRKGWTCPNIYLLINVSFVAVKQVNTLVLASVLTKREDAKVVETCLPKSLKKFNEDHGVKNMKNQTNCKVTIPDFHEDR